MRSKYRRKLDGAESAAAFVRANPLSDPGHQALATQLEERVAHAEVLIAEQSAGRSSNRAVRASRREAKKALNAGLLRHVISVAALAAAERPDLFGGVRLPKGKSYRAYAAQVQGILATVTAQRDALVAHGLGETALADLEKAVAELERLTDAVFETQREHVHATADLTETVAKISALIGVMDGIYRYRFAKDPERLATWASARNVVTITRRKDAGAGPVGGLDQAA
jgi:hypothetical protein